MIGSSPSVNFIGSPPAVSAVQIVTFGSAGSLAGFGSRPPAAGQLPSWSPPRTHIRRAPSGEKARPVSSWPSSAVLRVTWRGLNKGPLATQTLRTPRMLCTQAITSPDLAETRFCWNG